jgi:bisphosphoglycerate-dependent phosphoglycerate mutase
MSPTIYLVRHGAIISVAGKAFIGQIEAPLSEEGGEQAWALRRWLEPVCFSRVISSDLLRSQRTAKIILGRRSNSIEATPALREISSATGRVSVSRRSKNDSLKITPLADAILKTGGLRVAKALPIAVRASTEH